MGCTFVPTPSGKMRYLQKQMTLNRNDNVSHYCIRFSMIELFLNHIECYIADERHGFHPPRRINGWLGSWLEHWTIGQSFHWQSQLSVSRFTSRLTQTPLVCSPVFNSCERYLKKTSVYYQWIYKMKVVS